MENVNMGGMMTSQSLTPQQMLQSNTGPMIPSSVSAAESQSLTAMSGKSASASMYDMCKQHLHQFVQVTTNDNSTYTGIITGVDNDYVHLAVPNWGTGMSSPEVYTESIGVNTACACPSCMARSYHRGMHHYGGFHQGRPPHYGYGYGPGYGGGYGGYYPYGYYRPFNRYTLPLATLVALSLLPWY